MLRRSAPNIAAALAVLFLAACGSVDVPQHAAAPKASPSPTPTQSAQVADSPCPNMAPLSQPPTPTRLPADRTYGAFQITLQVVDPSVQPKISARTAFDRLNMNGSQSGCDLREELAYLSDAGFRCCIPPECMPGASPSAKPCDESVVKPVYQHLLSWVITWRSECGMSSGGGAGLGRRPGSTPPPPPPPMTCTTLTFVDATTGIAHETTSGSGATS